MKIVMLACLFLAAFAARPAGMLTPPNPEVPRCAECAVDMPSLPVPASWVRLGFTQSAAVWKPGDCVKSPSSDTQEPPCDQPRTSCELSGYVYLTEVNTGANVKPTPPKDDDNPQGWELTSPPGAQKKWKARIGSASTAEIVACGGEDDIGLSVTLTDQQGNRQSHPVKFKCAKCPNQPDPE